MDPIYKKTIIIALVFLLIAPLTLASDWATWDNYKVFEKQCDGSPGNNGQGQAVGHENKCYGTIEIWDEAIFGNDKELAKHSLLENTEFCTINCQAEGYSILYEDQILFQDLFFKDTSGNLVEINGEKILVGVETEVDEEVPIVELVCPNGDNSTGNCYNNIKGYKNEKLTKIIWSEYNGEILQEGDYYWKVQGEKRPSQSVDFILKSAGIDLTEWAWWYSWQNWNDDFELPDLNTTFWENLTSASNPTSTVFGNASGSITTAGDGYYNASARIKTDGTGTTARAASWIRTVQNFNDSRDYKINFTYEPLKKDGQFNVIEIINGSRMITGLEEEGFGIVYAYNFDVRSKEDYFMEIFRNGTIILSNSTDIVNSTDASALNEWYVQFRVMGVAAGGSITWVTEMLLYNFTVDQIESVQLISPADNATQLGNDVNFTCNVAGSVGNVTLINNGVEVSTNTSGVEGNYTFNESVGISNTWTCKLTSTDGAEFFGENRTLTTGFTANNISFANLTSETANETFVLNITKNPSSIVDANAILHYNGTAYLSSKQVVGNDIIFTNLIDIPLISGSVESELKDFTWDVQLIDATTSFRTNVSSSTQNVSRLHLEICDATYTTVALNFTAYDEGNESRIDPFTFEGTLEFWTGAGDIRRSEIISNVSTNEVALCLSPTTETFNIEGEISYTDPSGTYVPRNYNFIEGNTISSTQQDIALYLLKSASATTFIQHVIDGVFNVPGAVVKTFRFFPSTNTYNLVESGTTDSDGKTVGFYETETVDYRHEIFLDGVLRLNETEGRKVFVEATPATIQFNIGEALVPPTPLVDGTSGLTSSLVFNETTEIATYTYADTNSSFDSGRLFVYKDNFATAAVTVCDVSSAVSSAIITCNLSGLSGRFVAIGNNNRSSTEIADKITNINLNSGKDTLGNSGLLAGWFIILVASMVFLGNEIAGIVAVDAALIFNNVIGFWSLGGTTIWGILIVSAITIFLMSRK